MGPKVDLVAVAGMEPRPSSPQSSHYTKPSRLQRKCI